MKAHPTTASSGHAAGLSRSGRTVELGGSGTRAREGVEDEGEQGLHLLEPAQQRLPVSGAQVHETVAKAFVILQFIRQLLACLDQDLHEGLGKPPLQPPEVLVAGNLPEDRKSTRLN